MNPQNICAFALSGGGAFGFGTANGVTAIPYLWENLRQIRISSVRFAAGAVAEAIKRAVESEESAYGHPSTAEIRQTGFS